MRRARSQVDADGATVTTRSRNDGMSVHGTARSRPGGTTTTGPSPSSAAAPPSNEDSSLAPLCFSTSSSPGCGRPWAMRRSTKRFIWTSRSGTLPTVCSRTRRPATTIACSTLSTVDELDQRVPAELVEELVQVELAFPGLVAARRPARAGLDRRLEPPPLALEGVPARGGHLGRPRGAGSRRAALPVRPLAPCLRGAVCSGRPARSLAIARSRTAAGGRRHA